LLEGGSYAVMPATHPEWASLNDIIETEVGLALLGDKAVADALADAAEAVDAKLVELGY